MAHLHKPRRNPLWCELLGVADGGAALKSAPVPAAVGALDKPVAVHGGPAVPGAHVISIDNRASGRTLAAHAFAGAHRPAVLSFPFDRDRRPRQETGPDPDGVAFPVTRERLLGIYDGCREVGIDPGGLPVAVLGRTDPGSAAEMAEALLDARDPDAVIVMSDLLAFAVLDAVRARGLRVPDDVAVAGWDAGPDALREGLTPSRSRCSTRAAPAP